MTTKPLEARYFHILQQAAFAGDSHSLEIYLAEAFELGRVLIGQAVAPDEVSHIHHKAVVSLAEAHPDMTLAEVAERLTAPLMEMSMAYGMVFREQMEQRYQAMINARLEQSNKLEAVGTLAAGIAHDFNNLLGTIIGFAEMAGDELSDGSSGKHSIEQVLIASFRARDLVARMLAFARQSPPGAAVKMDLVGQIREMLALLNVSYKADLNIRFQATVERATVMADPGQLQQIVMNLCINAADATDQHGTIGVYLDACMLEDGRNGVCLTVSDNGHGMPPEVRERIFDPFFTTKAPNKGSGLGLSVVYGIVSQLGGVIDVQSRVAGVNPGTEFRVYLPLAEDKCR